MIGLVYRGEEYSPNDNVAKDKAVLEAVGICLTQRGESVRYLSEEDLCNEDALQDLDGCISMARRWKSLLTLQKAVGRGMWVKNDPSSVQVTVQSRSTTLEVLQSAGLPVVPFWSYEPSEDRMFQCEPELQELLPGWVKAMHPRGVNAGDVCRVETPLETDVKIIQRASEGYTDIIVARHLEGTLQKVYLVGDQCWPTQEYADLVRRVSVTIGLEILGVDLIVTESGPYIIDVNDFPSFSSCREEAASAIANLYEATKP